MIHTLPDHRALAVPADVAASIGDVPTKPTKDPGTVLIPWADTVVEALNLKGHDVPSPMQSLYKYKGYEPYEHQQRICEFASTHRRCFILGDIGTGKTWCIASLCDWLMQPNRPLGDKVKRPLILVPKSTSLDVWSREIFANFNHHHYIAPQNTGKARKIREHTDGFLILNHDAIRTPAVLDAIIEWGPDMLIVDEATAYKTWNSGRTKQVRQIVKQCNPERIIYATGTPMPQSPMDMYGQAKMICPEAIPSTKKAFQEATMYKAYDTAYGGKWKPKSDCADTINRWIAPHSIRVDIEDTDIDLPDAKFGDVRLPQTPDQKKYMAALKKEAYAVLDCGGALQAANEAIVMSKILQLAGGSAIGTDGGYVEVDASPKYEKLAQVIRACDGPIIVFASFKSHVDTIVRFCKEQGHRTEFVDGRVTSAQKRSKIFRRFQNGDIDVLVANPAAMAHGITLTRSNMIVWWSLPFRGEVYLQANGRIRRISQERVQYYIHLICSDAEFEVLSRLKNGIALQGTLMKMIKDGVI